MDKEFLKFCTQACINSYNGKHGEVKKIFDIEKPFKNDVTEGYFGIDCAFPFTLYVIFQGSQEDRDWLDNINFVKKELNKISSFESINSKIEVHSGFLRQYLNIKDIVENQINENGYNNIIIIGHSLGGAIATLCSFDLSLNYKNKKIKCVTLGSPRVGNRDFVKSYNNIVLDSTRITNEDDPVVKVPWMLLNYGHVASKLQIGKRTWYKFFTGDTESDSTKNDHSPIMYLENLEKL